MAIHPTAIVDASAKIDADAEIGPYCVIHANVEIGAGTHLMAHVYCEGQTRIGRDNVVFPYTTIGVASQDLKYRGEPAETRIGDRNKIRECVTIHRGTQGGGLVTSIGSDNLLMAYAHVAHDVRMGDHLVLANGVTLAGHVELDDWVTVGAFSGVHQFCRIGRHAFVGGYSVITQDVMPFSNVVSAREAAVFGANRTGLERRGYTADQIEPLQTAFRLLTRAGLNTKQAIAKINAEVAATPEINELLEFIAGSQRGVIKG